MKENTNNIPTTAHSTWYSSRYKLLSVLHDHHHTRVYTTVTANGVLQKGVFVLFGKKSSNNSCWICAIWENLTNSCYFCRYLSQ